MTLLELTNEEIDKYIDELYSCFPTGREFEIFLNSFLDKPVLKKLLLLNM